MNLTNISPAQWIRHSCSTSPQIHTSNIFWRRSQRTHLDVRFLPTWRERIGMLMLWLMPSLRIGSYQSWDFEPSRDAVNEFVRSNMDLTNFEQRSRVPMPSKYP